MESFGKFDFLTDMRFFLTRDIDTLYSSNVL